MAKVITGLTTNDVRLVTSNGVGLSSEFLSGYQNVVFDQAHQDYINGYVNQNYGIDSILRISEVLESQEINLWNKPFLLSPLKSAEQIQQANYWTRTLIMSDNELRNHYDNGVINGYSGSFGDQRDLVDIFSDDPYWQRVNSGKMEITDDGWTATCYGYDLEEGEEPLSYMEQLRIRDAIESAKMHIYTGKGDLTDPDIEIDLE